MCMCVFIVKGGLGFRSRTCHDLEVSRKHKGTMRHCLDWSKKWKPGTRLWPIMPGT